MNASTANFSDLRLRKLDGFRVEIDPAHERADIVLDRPPLNVIEMDAFYGKKQVLFGIDIALPERRVAAVIGPNGAGKSTVLRAIFGLGPQREGLIRFNDKDISATAAQENIAAGIAFVPQGARVFRDLTVSSIPARRSVRSRKCSTCFRFCASAGPSAPAPSPAVSGRCSPSAWR